MKYLFLAMFFAFTCVDAQIPILYVKRPVPLPPLRQADIGWSKRIWRTIDLREKLNLQLYYPSYSTDRYSSLFDILNKAVFSGLVTAYSANDDDFSRKLSSEDLKNLLINNDSIVFMEIDDEGNEHEVRTTANDTTGSEAIIQYYIKEDWFFDTKRSVLDVRIIGICPVRYDEEKDLMIPLYWINFNECRPVLAGNYVISPDNDVRPLTFDDLFLKRMFSSFIYKESNVYDRALNQYLVGSEFLQESEKIKQEIFNFESDMWHY